MARLSPLPRHRFPRLSMTATVATLTVGAMAVVACSSATGGSPTTTTTAPTTTSTTALDPGPGPTSLAGVAIGFRPLVRGLATSSSSAIDPATGQVRVGLDSPIALTARPGRNQLWIAERGGRVRILSIDTSWDRAAGTSERTGYTLLPGNALDLSSLTTTDGERGLLGLAFSTDGRTLFVDHTAANGDVVVAAYTVEDKTAFSGGIGIIPPKADSVAAVDPRSRKVLLTIPHTENSNHNGGQLQRGPDGYLYIGVGDGGGSGDLPGNAQSTEVLLGKILRIDPATPAPAVPYAIPVDNPFAEGGGLPEIFLWGVRNPWRFSFDRLNRDLWVADVGQEAVEEIDWLPADAGSGRGSNLGWNWLEGTATYRTDGTAPAGMVGPLHTYGHEGGACSITGGYVYRGSEVPDLDGTYLYGDYCTGQMRGLLSRKGIVLDDQPLGTLDPNTLVSFGEDDRGELYVISSTGTIYLVVAA